MRPPTEAASPVVTDGYGSTSTMYRRIVFWTDLTFSRRSQHAYAVKQKGGACRSHPRSGETFAIENKGYQTGNRRSTATPSIFPGSIKYSATLIDEPRSSRYAPHSSEIRGSFVWTNGDLIGQQAFLDTSESRFDRRRAAASGQFSCIAKIQDGHQVGGRETCADLSLRQLSMR